MSLHDEKQIERISTRQFEAYLAGDAEGYLNPIAENRIVMSPGEPARIGKRDKAELAAFLACVNQTAEVEIEEIVAENEWAFEWGTGRGTLTPNNAPPGVDPTLSYTYKYLRIWRKGEQGWKVVRMIWNLDDDIPSVFPYLI